MILNVFCRSSTLGCYGLTFEDRNGTGSVLHIMSCQFEGIVGSTTGSNFSSATTLPGTCHIKNYEHAALSPVSTHRGHIVHLSPSYFAKIRGSRRLEPGFAMGLRVRLWCHIPVSH